jgi:hypothetical protein
MHSVFFLNSYLVSSLPAEIIIRKITKARMNGENYLRKTKAEANQSISFNRNQTPEALAFV